jgi:hypothetical protein
MLGKFDMDPVARDLTQALSHMRAALDLLDKNDVAHDAGAHLDLAISRLSDFLNDLSSIDLDAVRNRQTH